MSGLGGPAAEEIGVAPGGLMATVPAPTSPGPGHREPGRERLPVLPPRAWAAGEINPRR